MKEAEEGRWIYGRGPDGYAGWIRAWHLLPDPGGAIPDRSVTARWSRALAEPRADSAILRDLSFGTRLAPSGPSRNGYVPWRLPDGRCAWTPQRDLDLLSAGMAAAPALLELRARRLLGLPYEWGGRSSAGLDCSAFIQLLYSSLGLALPRDAGQQAESGSPGLLTGMEDWRPGDLVFYGSGRIEHVGLWLGAGLLIHASGEVRIERLDPGGRLPGKNRPAPLLRRVIL